jgi:hypothetical protein
MNITICGQECLRLILVYDLNETLSSCEALVHNFKWLCFDSQKDLNVEKEREDTLRSWSGRQAYTSCLQRRLHVWAKHPPPPPPPPPSYIFLYVDHTHTQSMEKHNLLCWEALPLDEKICHICFCRRSYFIKSIYIYIQEANTHATPPLTTNSMHSHTNRATNPCTNPLTNHDHF